MSAQVIDGKAMAGALRERVAAATSKFKKSGVTPGLAVVLIGDDPASAVYVRNKGRASEAAGIASFEHRLSGTTPEDDVIALVRLLSRDDRIDGILVQMPLPAHISAAKVIDEIDPAKDVDGLTATSAGRLILGQAGLVPCTPQGASILIKSARPALAGLNAVVVGRSILVGRPLAMLLLAENCTVTVAHSKTRDLATVCRSADILCAAVGRARLIRGDWVKADAVVIDVGINRIIEAGAAKLVGDVDFEGAVLRAGWITPVPGGVGPMTIACLLRNTVIAAARRRDLREPEL